MMTQQAPDLRPKDLARHVVVITGASSGIGRATALEFGRRRASVVAAARNQAALQSVADEIDRLGGNAIPVVTDVSDFEQVADLASRAAERFGHINTWVNNAAVSTYGTVEQMDAAELHRVVEVNLMGEIYGMKAALPYLRESGGSIINVSSALGERAISLQAAYCAAKHGVVGFGEALRLELKAAGSPVQVVDVLPSSMNTPLFNHARSKLGVKPKPVGRIYEPQVAAEAIVAAAQRPVRQVYVGFAGRLLAVLQRISPRLTDWYMAGPGDAVAGQRTDRPDDGVDNLFTASTGPGRTTGDFGERSKSTSIYTRALAPHPAIVRTAMLTVAAMGVMALRRGRGRT
ncbi:SDR family oxidoreductase [Agromyces ramosus]|uniref:NAD(P)-dependent dehydrogenase (Short-subunit alcohol dehydrogenase family) n=1 Tax=Agromyces ramosus TaxID=33879 RepID=A0ABU0R778_9MICO|nr:SDR family oxidoreductase [Agromyces ramosus]MDQ0893622.1 NAD(P)-dependent dehydrogenase (short-subunit alcohol dehydrogenase family) [Agromyces ramosus]